jgi:uncharacterized protein YbbC (DUF1343 family)
MCPARYFGLGILTVVLLVPAVGQSQSPSNENVATAKQEIRTAIESAIAEGDLPGAIVGFWHNGQWLVKDAYGDRQVLPEREPMAMDTIFDMASITKPVSTATSAAILVERGQIDPEAPVRTYIPEFTGEGRDAVLVKHLMRHTAGLIPDNALEDYQSGPDLAWKKLYESSIKSPPGTKFVYSDVCFELLGKIVENVSGKPLHEFAKANIFEPLKMLDTGYLPPTDLIPRIAPTEPRDGKMLRGIVHDPRAALLGGVAGHAGLFSTLEDLSRYGQMMLGDGRFGEVKIMNRDTVTRLTTPHLVESRADFGPVTRTNGFDHHSPYSYNSGNVLSEAAYGHGGFTGTVFWIDPDRNCFFIFLSNRLHPDGKGNVNKLAGSVSKTIVERCLPPLVNADPWTAIKLGIDVLRQSNFRALQGKRVGLVSNHTGRNAAGISTAQILKDSKVVQLVALFSPEHGFQGLLDQSRIGDSTADDLQLPIYSLYGQSRKPTAEQLAKVDCLVYDIQDIGCRFYTYISTMKECMQAAAENGKQFVVLDRPNPIGGVRVAGPLVDSGSESFVACHNLPVQHGMTVGELALMFNKELKMNLDLQIIPVRHWNRNQMYDQTGLEWVDPSPNMRSQVAAELYPGIGLLETTNISVGRGTDRPFEWLGAPWVNSRQLADWLNRQSLSGVRAIPRSMTPTTSKYANEKCGGIQLLVTDDDQLDAILLGLTVAKGLQELYPKEWKANLMKTLLVNEKVMQAIVAGADVKSLFAIFEADLEAFKKRRAGVLLYE